MQKSVDAEEHCVQCRNESIHMCQTSHKMSKDSRFADFLFPIQELTKQSNIFNGIIFVVGQQTKFYLNVSSTLCKCQFKIHYKFKYYMLSSHFKFHFRYHITMLMSIKSH